MTTVSYDTEKPTPIEEYLNQIVRLISTHQSKCLNGYQCLEDFVLRHGQLFKQRPVKIQRGRMGECYKNAADMALDNPLLIYCEGYAIGVIPVMHAWCVTRSGYVLDPTWKNGNGYFGVPIKTDYLRRSLLRRKVYGVLDDWPDGWRMVHADTNEWKEEL